MKEKASRGRGYTWRNYHSGLITIVQYLGGLDNAVVVWKGGTKLATYRSERDIEFHTSKTPEWIEEYVPRKSTGLIYEDLKNKANSIWKRIRESQDRNSSNANQKEKTNGRRKPNR